MADHVTILGTGHFQVGPAVRTSEQLTRLYGIDLVIESTPCGRRVVSPRANQGRGIH